MSYLSVLILLISCRQHKPPVTELCISKETNNSILLCEDKKLPDNQREYERELSLGDVCSNGNDFVKLRDYCSDLRVKLIECEAN